MNADVCLFLEGTYPYVAGGVSSWVHALLRDLSSLRFSLVYLGASEEMEREFQYPIPDNVVEFREVFLQGSVPPRGAGRAESSGPRTGTGCGASTGVSGTGTWAPSRSW
ncbi:MAG: DUF3492 domain-containing protein [Planctomycetes bacterium]|nr:DUF3492 domain-containing protein [Planctomycetota bacterium]